MRVLAEGQPAVDQRRGDRILAVEQERDVGPVRFPADPGVDVLAALGEHRRRGRHHPRDPHLHALHELGQPRSRRPVPHLLGLAVDDVENRLDRGELEAVGGEALGEELVVLAVEAPGPTEAVDHRGEAGRRGDVRHAVAVADRVLEDVAPPGDTRARV